MGQSIDYRKIELVSQFAGLLEAFSDPNLKETIKEAQKVIDEKKALLGPLATKQNLDAYLDKTEQEMNVKREKMASLLQQAQDKAVELVAQASMKNSEAAEQLAAAKVIKEEAEEALKTVKEELAVQKKLTEALNKESETLGLMKTEVATQLEALKAKQAKLQQVLGE